MGGFPAWTRGQLHRPHCLYPDIRVRQNELYFQDDIHVSKTFTVNAGVRYSIFRQPTDMKGMLTNFDPAANPSQAPQIDRSTGNILPGTGDPLNGIIVNGSDKNPYGAKSANENLGNIAPRFGFAWDPTGAEKLLFALVTAYSMTVSFMASTNRMSSQIRHM